jgi:predicted permease
MLWRDKMRMRLEMLLHRGREIERLNSEFDFHLEQLIAEKVAAGMTPEEARFAAMRAFGNPTLLREQVGETWSWNQLELLVREIGIRIRTLARTPGFAFISILVIAIGIGSNVALFTVVQSVLLKPLPFKEPNRLLRLYEHSADDKFPYNTVAGGVFEEWKKQSDSFSDLAILLSWPEYNLSASGGQLPEKIRGAECSWNLFPMLGVEPVLGRAFTAADDKSSAEATVVLSWGLWKRRFGGDPSILNRTIRLDAKPYTVIGIMPQWFAYPERAVQLWTPIYHQEPPSRWRSLDAHMFVVIGRLKPGTTPTLATSDVSLIVRRLHDQNLGDPFVSKAANARPLLDDMVGEIRAPLYMLLGATGCVLLIACLNVANLLVARASARRRELAIRAALGGSRLRLFGEQLIESLVLSAIGGGLGLMLAYGVVQWLVNARQDMSRAEGVHIDHVVLAFTVGLVCLCAVLAGVISSIASVGRGTKTLSSLQESSRSYSSGRSRASLRKLLLSLEIGLTVVLLIAAGLLLKSYERLRASDLGCTKTNVLTMGFSLPEAQYSEPTQRVAFFETLLARVRGLPGVETAGLVTVLPGEGWSQDNGFAIAEHPPLPSGQSQDAIVRWADPDYFSSIGIPILRGNTFSKNQRLDRAMKVVISDSFARQFFEDEDPIGRHLITLGNKSYEIVGVVGNTRFAISKPPQPMMYFPLYAGTETGSSLVVRSSRDPESIALPIQGIVQQLDRDLPVSNILTMEELVDRSTIDTNFDATLLLTFAVLSLALAAVGLFGVLSYIVAQRTSEIGIRIALGAERQSVLVLVLLDGLRPAFSGLAFGIFGAIAAAQLMRSMLYGISPLDPAVFTGVTATLLGVAAGACLIPAWRAAHLDPMKALRVE